MDKKPALGAKLTVTSSVERTVEVKRVVVSKDDQKEAAKVGVCLIVVTMLCDVITCWYTLNVLYCFLRQNQVGSIINKLKAHDDWKKPAVATDGSKQSSSPDSTVIHCATGSTYKSAL